MRAKNKKERDKIRHKLWLKSNKTCTICNNKIMLENVTIDHVIPKLYCGVNSMKNYRSACLDCNSRRGHKINISDLFNECTKQKLSNKRIVKIICKYYTHNISKFIKGGLRKYYGKYVIRTYVQTKKRILN